MAIKVKPNVTWFTPEILEFLLELGQNNNTKWFGANKERYETHVWEPMKALARDLIARMAGIDPEIRMTPEEAVFRLYRDTRTSIDKSPFKTPAGMLISRSDATRTAHPGLYIQIAPQAFGIASGFHVLSPVECMAVRRHIAANAEEFKTLLAGRSFRRHFATIRGESGKLLPPELTTAAEKQPMIHKRQFYYWAEHHAGRILSSNLPEFIMEHMEACRPMNEFLGRALVR
jgi:uncharacterized protein (TIGR02453 family)